MAIFDVSELAKTVGSFHTNRLSLFVLLTHAINSKTKTIPIIKYVFEIPYLSTHTPIIGSIIIAPIAELFIRIPPRIIFFRYNKCTLIT